LARNGVSTPMVETQREREDKYDVGLDFEFPPLTAAVPHGGRLDEADIRLDSTYFDTPDRSLLRNRMVLRRRVGDADAGWQLKVPADDARTEIRSPLVEGSESIPGELAELISGVTHRAGLDPVALIRTSRHAHRIFDSNDALIVEIDDDTVRASAFGDEAALTTWREVEVEAGNCTEDTLAVIGARLREAGAQRAESSSKFERALAPVTPAEASADLDEPEALEVVTDYVAHQIREIVAGDVALRRGLDPVHDTRVAIRRLRSSLRTFKSVFDADQANALREELSWYAGLLGEMRDATVQRKRLRKAVNALDPSLVVGDVNASLDRHLGKQYSDARRAVEAALVTDRYAVLMASLAQWQRQPAFSADLREYPTLKPAVRKADRKARKRLRKAVRAGVDEQAFHRARKAAKRARYAAELAAPVLGRKSAKKKIKQHKKVQRILGDHQDSVVAAQLLRELGAGAGRVHSAEQGFTYGVLYANERTAAERSRRTAARRLCSSS
jgi:CHAD domain-containing protein